MFTPEQVPNVTLTAADVAAFTLDRPADLISCVHGLHYLGDKLGFIQHACAMLTPGGLLLAHLDPDNLRASGAGASIWRQAVRHAAKGGAAVDFKGHVLRIARTEAPLNFGLTFQGAPARAPFLLRPSFLLPAFRASFLFLAREGGGLPF